jgi:hypothetical protein
MKLQWVLLGVVLAAVVFGVTYLKLNSGGTSKTEDPETPPPTAREVKLYFPQKLAHAELKTTAGAEWESHKPGHFDFWFESIDDEPIPLGLASQTCKCTKVEIALASDKWKKWNDSVFRWTRPEPTRDWQTLPDKSPGVVIPPRASGWVRINWKVDGTGANMLKVQLWAHAPDNPAPRIELNTPVLVVPPAMMEERTKSIGALTAEQHETNPVEFVCWSATRADFVVKPVEGSDPFLVLSKPIPLTYEERKRMGERINARVLCAYRILVSVRDRLEDGRPIELGPFRRVAFLRIDGDTQPLLDDDKDPLRLMLTGRVKGDVVVLAPEGPDQIEMGDKGYFNAPFGDVKEATIESRNLGLKLTLDKERTAGFLRVDVRENEVVPGTGIKTWTIRVEVPPNRAAGEFPREDNPDYRDSAVYLKLTDAKNSADKPRLVRIPVSGKAVFR